MRAALLGVALACAAVSVHAAEVPQPGKNDPRVRTVVYDPMNVVRVEVADLRSPMIELAPDETVIMVGCGDCFRSDPASKGKADEHKGVAWQVVATGSYIAVKSQLSPGRVSDLHVVTHRPDGSERTYNFDLVPLPPDSADPGVYEIKFSYPADIKAAKQKAWQAAQARKEEREAKAKLKQDWFYGARNWRYEARGAKEIEPAEVSDNGEMTTFRFPGRTKLPAIYEVTADGKEQIASYTVRQDTVVVHGISRLWRLRDGGLVCDVRNLWFHPEGYDPQTGTTTPAVVRTTKAAANG